MAIDRKNYETYFIDYLEGNLDDSLVDEFIEFIRKNPDLEKELKSYRSIKVNATDISYPRKENLYKEKYDSPEVFDRTAIALLENDLGQEEINEFEQYLEKHSDKKKELELFSKMKLEADETVIYKNKRRLYQLTVLQKFRYYTLRIAAVLLLIFSFSVLFRHYSEIKVPPVTTAALSDKEAIEPAEPLVRQDGITPEKQKISVNTAVDEAKNVQPVAPARIKEQPEDKNKELALTARDTTVPTLLASVPAEITTLQPVLKIEHMERVVAQEVPELNRRDDEKLLAEKIKEKTGLGKLRLMNIVKSGLNLISGISKDKFTYDTDKKGDITEIKLDTRLLAFTIPTNHTGR